MRPKELYDNAVPSGNAAAAEVLFRMALLTGEPAYEREGVRALRLVRNGMVQAAAGFGHALCALDTYLGPTDEIAIVGDPEDERTRALINTVAVDRFHPRSVIALGRPGGVGVPLLADRPQIDGRPTAYVCRNFVCDLPVTEPDQLVDLLSA